MAKSGLKWFRIDVVFDDKFELVCAEYGSKAFEVIVRLWQKIYESSYYCEWNEEVALLFAKKYSLGYGAVSEITKCAVKRGLFDKELFDRFGVLTSHGIQDWYFSSIERRKAIEVVDDYLLIDISQKLENVDILHKNVNINAENASKNEYITNIHNRHIEREGVRPPAPDAKRPFRKPTLEEVTAYCRERGSKVDPQRFMDYYEANGWKVGKSSMQDWRAAVRSWETNGIRSGGKGRNAQNFEQREYGREELDSYFANED